MEKQKKHIDDFFKEQLGSYAETPPPGAWDAFEKQLGNVKPASAHFTFAKLVYILAIPVVVLVSIPFIKKIYNRSSHAPVTAMADTKNSPVNENNDAANTNGSDDKKADAGINNNGGSENASTTGNLNKENGGDDAQTGTKRIASNSLKNNFKTGDDQQTAGNHPPEQTRNKQSNLNASTSSGAGNTKNIIAQVGQNRTQNTIEKHAKNTNDGLTKSKNRDKSGKNAKNNGQTLSNAEVNAAETWDKGSISDDKIAAETNTGLGLKEQKPNASVGDSKVIKEPAGTFKAGAAPVDNNFVSVDSVIKSNQNNKKNTKHTLSNLFAVPAQSKGKFEAGIKAGEEGSTSASAARKILASPYLKYNLSNRLSVMTQPSIKSATVNYKSLNGSQSFYKVNNDGKVSLTNTVYVHDIPDSTFIDTSFAIRTYSYSQSHDSITKSYNFGGSYLEFEIPVLLNLRINKHLSAYGGVTLTYSRLIGIYENTYTKSNIVETGIATTQTPYKAPANTPADISQVITYDGTPISKYSPLYPSPSGNLFRVGYMVGLSYEFWDRWMLDGLMQQSNVKQNMVGGYNLNAALSATYFRFTIGYKIMK